MNENLDTPMPLPVEQTPSIPAPTPETMALGPDVILETPIEVDSESRDFMPYRTLESHYLDDLGVKNDYDRAAILAGLPRETGFEIQAPLVSDYTQNPIFQMGDLSEEQIKTYAEVSQFTQPEGDKATWLDVLWQNTNPIDAVQDIASLTAESATGIGGAIELAFGKRDRNWATDQWYHQISQESNTRIAADDWGKRFVVDTINALKGMTVPLAAGIGVGVTTLNPLLGAGTTISMMGAQVFGQKYSEIRREHKEMSPGYAASIAALHGAVEVGTEMIPGGPIMSMFQKSMGKNFMKGVGTKALTKILNNQIVEMGRKEFAQEALAGGLQNLIDWKAGLKEGEYGWIPLAKDALYEGMVGFFTAPFMNAGTSAGQRIGINIVHPEYAKVMSQQFERIAPIFAAETPIGIFGQELRYRSPNLSRLEYEAALDRFREMQDYYIKRLDAQGQGDTVSQLVRDENQNRKTSDIYTQASQTAAERIDPINDYLYMYDHWIGGNMDLGAFLLANELYMQDPVFGAKGTLVLANTVHEMSSELRARGLNINVESDIAGFTRVMEDGKMVVGLITGHMTNEDGTVERVAQADTSVHEWFHTLWERLNFKDRDIYSRWYSKEVKSREGRYPTERDLQEAFAEHGTNVFFNRTSFSGPAGLNILFKKESQVGYQIMSRVLKRNMMGEVINQDNITRIINGLLPERLRRQYMEQADMMDSYSATAFRGRNPGTEEFFGPALLTYNPMSGYDEGLIDAEDPDRGREIREAGRRNVRRMEREEKAKLDRYQTDVTLKAEGANYPYPAAPMEIPSAAEAHQLLKERPKSRGKNRQRIDRLLMAYFNANPPAKKQIAGYLPWIRNVEGSRRGYDKDQPIVPRPDAFTAEDQEAIDRRQRLRSLEARREQRIEDRWNQVTSLSSENWQGPPVEGTNVPAPIQPSLTLEEAKALLEKINQMKPDTKAFYQSMLTLVLSGPIPMNPHGIVLKNGGGVMTEAGYDLSLADVYQLWRQIAAEETGEAPNAMPDNSRKMTQAELRQAMQAHLRHLAGLGRVNPQTLSLPDPDASRAPSEEGPIEMELTDGGTYALRKTRAVRSSDENALRILKDKLHAAKSMLANNKDRAAMLLGNIDVYWEKYQGTTTATWKANAKKKIFEILELVGVESDIKKEEIWKERLKEKGIPLREVYNPGEIWTRLLKKHGFLGGTNQIIRDTESQIQTLEARMEATLEREVIFEGERPDRVRVWADKTEAEMEAEKEARAIDALAEAGARRAAVQVPVSDPKSKAARRVARLHEREAERLDEILTSTKGENSAALKAYIRALQEAGANLVDEENVRLNAPFEAPGIPKIDSLFYKRIYQNALTAYQDTTGTSGAFYVSIPKPYYINGKQVAVKEYKAMLASAKKVEAAAKNLVQWTSPDNDPHRVIQAGEKAGEQMTLFQRRPGRIARTANHRGNNPAAFHWTNERDGQDRASMGLIPDQMPDTVSWKGGYALMDPTLFLSLAAPIFEADAPSEMVLSTDKKVEEMANVMWQPGKRVAPPWLDMAYNEGRKRWEVLQHEGRHRTRAYLERADWEELIPVAFTFRGGYNAKYPPSPEAIKDLLSGRFITEKGKDLDIPPYLMGAMEIQELYGKTVDELLSPQDQRTLYQTRKDFRNRVPEAIERIKMDKAPAIAWKKKLQAQFREGPLIMTGVLDFLEKAEQEGRKVTKQELRDAYITPSIRAIPLETTMGETEYVSYVRSDYEDVLVSKPIRLSPKNESEVEVLINTSVQAANLTEAVLKMSGVYASPLAADFANGRYFTSGYNPEEIIDAFKTEMTEKWQEEIRRDQEDTGGQYKSSIDARFTANMNSLLTVWGKRIRDLADMDEHHPIVRDIFSPVRAAVQRVTDGSMTNGMEKILLLHAALEDAQDIFASRFRNYRGLHNMLRDYQLWGWNDASRSTPHPYLELHTISIMAEDRVRDHLNLLQKNLQAQMTELAVGAKYKDNHFSAAQKDKMDPSEAVLGWNLYRDAILDQADSPVFVLVENQSGLFQPDEDSKDYAAAFQKYYPLKESWAKVLFDLAVVRASRLGYSTLAWSTGMDRHTRWPSKQRGGSTEKGMKAHYDGTLVSIAKKLAKRTKSEYLGVDTINQGEHEVHVFRISPELAAEATTEGVTLFQRRPGRKETGGRAYNMDTGKGDMNAQAAANIDVAMDRLNLSMFKGADFQKAGLMEIGRFMEEERLGRLQQVERRMQKTEEKLRGEIEGNGAASAKTLKNYESLQGQKARLEQFAKPQSMDELEARIEHLAQLFNTQPGVIKKKTLPQFLRGVTDPAEAIGLLGLMTMESFDAVEQAGAEYKATSSPEAKAVLAEAVARHANIRNLLRGREVLYGRGLNILKRVKARIRQGQYDLAMELAQKASPDLSDLNQLAEMIRTSEDPRDLMKMAFRYNGNRFERWHYFSILSGPTTHIADFMSVLWQTFVEHPLEEGLSTMFDVFRPNAKSRRTFAGYQQLLRRTFNLGAISAAMQNSYDILMSDAEAQKANLKGSRARDMAMAPTGDAMTDWANWTLNTPQRALLASARFGVSIIHSAVTAQLIMERAILMSEAAGKSGDQAFIEDAVRRMEADKPAEILEEAERRARYYVFEDRGGKISQMATQFRDLNLEGLGGLEDAFANIDERIANALEKGDRNLADKLYKWSEDMRTFRPFILVVPFINTLSRIMNFVWERTPGASLYYISRDAMSKGVGGVDTRRYTNAIVGLMAVFAGWIMSKLGKAVGAWSVDPKERDTLRGLGLEPNSVITPWGSFTYNRFDPVATLFGMGVSYESYQRRKAWETGEEPAVVDLAAAIDAFGETMLDKTYARGINEVVTLARASGSRWARFIGRTLASAVPNIFAHPIRSMDGTIRKPEDVMDYLTEKVTPWSLAARRDFFGREVEREGSFAWNLAAPTIYHAPRLDLVDKEIRRLGIRPPSIPDRLGQYELEGKEYDDFATEVGKMRLLRVSAVARRRYASDDIKAKKMLEAFQKATSSVRNKSKWRKLYQKKDIRRLPL